MGGIFAFLGAIWTSLSGLGAGALKAAAVIALDVGAALLGGSTAHGEKLKNKTIASSTYGHTIPRARGTVRLQGQLIFWNQIQETTHKSSSGGIFGIGEHSIYTYTYSTCCAFAFGKKLGGGQAAKFIRIWADGKLLYSSLVTDASLTGTATIVGTVSAGSQAIPVSLSGGSLTLTAGDLIQFGVYQVIKGVNTFVPSGANSYEVQQDVTIASGQTGIIDVYPPTDVDLTATAPITVIYIPGLSAPLIDLSSFDPNPHDGSHVILNPVPPGSIRFHLGSATEEPDPLMVKQFGVGQAAAYRGLPYVMLEWLQLANYGNHVPSISAEIAFDTATDAFPKAGPVPGVDLSTGSVTTLLPSPQVSAFGFTDPNSILPYVWVLTGTAPNYTLYKVDTRTNTLVGSVPLNTTGGLVSEFVIDQDGYIYFASGGWALFKWDGQGMSLADDYPLPILADNLQPWDMQASAFGSPVIMKFLGVKLAFGGIEVWDRKAFRPIGSLDPSSLTEAVLFWKTDGTAVTGPGDAAVLPASGDGNMVSDAKGNLWACSGGSLVRYDCQPQSGVYVDPLTFVPTPVMYPPSFNNTVVDVSSITVGSGHATTLFYSVGDNSIIVLGDNGLCKVSCDTFAITASNTASHPWSSGAVNVIGTVPDQIGSFCVFGSTGSFVWRYSVSTLQLLNTYAMGDWFGSFGFQGRPVYDGIGDTLWGAEGNQLYRLYLDRAKGDGVGLDSIVASIFAEAGYDPSEYNVTALAGILTGGYEVDQEAYLDSIKKLQQLFLFDMAEIDGVIVCVPRSNGLGAVTIPEDDLGATDIGTAPAARLSETLQQETDVPQKVWVQYYDLTKELQQATQYAMRITAPYSTALSGNPKVTNSKNQLTLSVPVTDSPGPMKQQAQSILLDSWQARMRFQWKTGPKYIRLDPTDKIQATYKGQTLDCRITSIDRGAGMALEFQGESYDSGVYDVVAVSGGGGGSAGGGIGGTGGGGTGGGSTGGGIGSDTYTLDPPCPLHQV